MDQVCGDTEIFQSHMVERIFQSLQHSKPMRIKLFVAPEIFCFNSNYYLMRDFIASTRAFHLLTCTFNLTTRAFNLETRASRATHSCSVLSREF